MINLFYKLSLWFNLIILFNINYIFLKKYNIIDYSFQLNLELWNLKNYNFNWLFLQLDSLSILCLLLTSWLIILSIIYINKQNQTMLIFCLNIINILLIICFSSNDLLIFYITFEAVLIPMFLIIGLYGSRTRKIKASYKFFIYTLFGSVFLLIGIILIWFHYGTTNLELILYSSKIITYQKQLLLWWLFFFAFAIKIPMIPFHVWLPEAHVEAPTVGSVLLAGILLKLGVYGFLKFSIPLFTDAVIYYTPILLTWSLIGVIYGSLTTLRQIDLKRIIAYSSVAHMNFIMLGIFSLNINALQGAIYLMIAHGWSTTSLFFIIGILYDKFHSKIIKYYGGLTTTMPLLSFFFLLSLLANMGIPGSMNFIGEFLLCIGIFEISDIACILSLISLILSPIYSLWLYERVFNGPIILPYKTKKFLFNDINEKEFIILFICFFIIFFFGIFPKFLNDYIKLYINLYIESIV